MTTSSTKSIASHELPATRLDPELAAKRADKIKVSMISLCGCWGCTLSFLDVDERLLALLDKITTWPTHDLFPKYGLPAFNKKAIGSAKPFGLGCLGSNGKLTLSVSGDPEIGRTQWFRMDNGLPQSVALLLIGFSKTSWGPFRLPLDLNSFGATGCKLYTSPDIILAFPTGQRGTITVPLRHPANPVYLGLRFFTQFFCLDSKANAWGATYSNAVATLLGGWRR